MVALLIGASALYNRLAEDIDHDNLSGTNTDTPDNTQQELPKQLPPDFTVMDASGKEVKLSDFRGKPTVVNFWASWCGPCKSEMPDFDAVYQEMGDEIHFLMVNMTDGGQETLAGAQKFIADSGYTFPVYYDTQYSAAIFGRTVTSGKVVLHSHLDTVCVLTPSASAACSWVIFFARRNRFRFLVKTVIFFLSFRDI